MKLVTDYSTRHGYNFFLKRKILVGEGTAVEYRNKRFSIEQVYVNIL